MRVVVLGLWHLGCVTAAALAADGHDVIGVDSDRRVIDALAGGTPPLYEPGLAELVREGLDSGRLSFTTYAGDALSAAEVLWVAYDTPVDDDDRADLVWLRERIDAVASEVRPDTLVMISSQVPVGFTQEMAARWRRPGVNFAYSPENLRLGRAIDAFRNPERVVVGLEQQDDRGRVEQLLASVADRIVWMSAESAEMTKHALNAFLATSVSFANEIARLCECTGADAREVEAGLKSEPRIGERAYVAPGAPFAGGTLGRDLRFLQALGDASDVETPLLDGVVDSNDRHGEWVRLHLARVLAAECEPRIAVLGLTYKPGTSTLRRSAAVTLCRWLDQRGAAVCAYDPEADVREGALPPSVDVKATAADALAGAHAAVIATPWPQFRGLSSDDFLAAMADAVVIDEGWSLERLAADERITYLAPGRATV